MELKSLLFRLSEACCVRETHPAARLVLEELASMGIPAAPDKAGNLVARLSGRDDAAPPFMLEAHLDEIAFIVTSVTPDGFLRVGKVGGPDLRVVAGHEVTVLGREPLFGVFCCRPPHLTGEEERKKAVPIDEAAVDVGMSREQAEKLVSPGDFIFLRRRPAELSPGLFTGKALDNRAGVAAVLLALDGLRRARLSRPVTALLALGEEMGERGSVTGCFGVAPESALVVDTSFALTEDSPAEKCGKMGAGPMVGFSPILDSGLTHAVCAAADRQGIAWQREIMAGQTGTDSDAIAVSRGGVRVALLSIPLRYMHTANEVIALSDVETTAAMIDAYVLTEYGAKEAASHA